MNYEYRMNTKSNKDLKQSKSNETDTKPVATENTRDEQNEVHRFERADSLDSGPEYIAPMQTGTEEIVSKPREGTRVTALVLCTRLRVFREIDPLPITAKAEEVDQYDEVNCKRLLRETLEVLSTLQKQGWKW